MGRSRSNETPVTMQTQFRLFWLTSLAAATVACSDSDGGSHPPDTSDAGDVSADSSADVASDVAADVAADATDVRGDASPGQGTCESPAVLTNVTDTSWSATGDTDGAAGVLDGSCSDGSGPEQVFAWTAPSDGRAVVTLQGPDPVLHVRGECGAPTAEIGCNDDSSDDTLNSEVVFFAEEGETYFIVADTFDAEEVGPFELALSLEEPSEPVLPPGLWQTQGYGMILEVTETDFAVYEYGVSYCVQADGGTVFALEEIIAELDTDPLAEGSLRVRLDGGVGWLVGDPIDALPLVCTPTTPIAGEADYVFDPLTEFDRVVEIFELHYPFFELRGIDWTSAAEAQRQTLTAESSEEDLEAALVALLDPLDDGHVSLVTPRIEFESKPFAAITQLEAEFEAQDEVATFEAYLQQELLAYFAAIDDRLEGLGGALDGVRWGRSDDIGYLRAFDFDTSAEAMHMVMEDAMTALSGVSAMVVDMRVNSGGSDTAAIAMASYFAETETLAFTKAPYLGDGAWGPATEVSTPACAAATCFDGPVIVLVSESTVSAAEIFVLAMRALDDVRVWGEPTSGELSDILGRTLPPGWGLGLTNERYIAADGELYESVGIPVDRALDGAPLDLQSRRDGEDPWLDAGLSGFDD